MVTLTPDGAKSVIRALLTDGMNHRSAVFEDINRQFLKYAIDYFVEVARAKLNSEDVSEPDWYLATLNDGLATKEDLAIRTGMPIKTIENIRGSTRREVVLEEGLSNHRQLLRTMEELLALNQPDLILTIKVGGVGIDLNVTESLVVINSLAVKRQQLSSGMWSAVGNAVERPLMVTLCELFEVEERFYRGGRSLDGRHQVDFMLQRSGVEYRCEVKLNGRGNPESVTAAIARNPRIVVADHVSSQNRKTLDANQVAWVALSDPKGYLRFGQALESFGFECATPQDLSRLDDILDEILPLP